MSEIDANAQGDGRAAQGTEDGHEGPFGGDADTQGENEDETQYQKPSADEVEHNEVDERWRLNAIR